MPLVEEKGRKKKKEKKKRKKRGKREKEKEKERREKRRERKRNSIPAELNFFFQAAEVSDSRRSCFDEGKHFLPSFLTPVYG